MKPATLRIIDEFFGQYHLKRYKKGHIFTLPGEMTEYAYLLIEGKMKVYDVSYRGDEIIINSFKAPAFFPLSIIINPAPARYIYEADSNIVIRRAPIKETREFLRATPDVVYSLLSRLYYDSDDIIERMILAITGNAKSRLVHALVIECRKFGDMKHDGSCHLAISEKELAAKAGMSRETVSREARSLKAAQLLEVHRNHLVVPNVSELVSYLDHHS
jgi:CRP-like cAMP-binding protein